MLLVIDVGNTNTVLGLYDDDRLVHDWRIRTEIDHTIDEYGVLISNLYHSSRMKEKRSKPLRILLFPVLCHQCSTFLSLYASSILTSNR